MEYSLPLHYIEYEYVVYTYFHFSHSRPKSPLFSSFKMQHTTRYTFSHKQKPTTYSTLEWMSIKNDKKKQYNRNTFNLHIHNYLIITFLAYSTVLSASQRKKK